MSEQHRDSQTTLEMIGVRRFRSRAGTLYVEVKRGDSFVVLVPDYYYIGPKKSRRGAFTVPIGLLVQQFEEVT